MNIIDRYILKKVLSTFFFVVLILMAIITVIDITEKTYVIELTGTGEKLDAFLEALDRALILETVRTGACGLGRGEWVIKV